MPAPTSATKHDRRIRRLQAVTIAAIRRAWGGMTPTGSWEDQYRTSVGPKIVALAAASQVAVTRESDQYAADVLNELAFGPPTQPGAVNPTSFAGFAGDGRSIESLLATSVGRARARNDLDEGLRFMEQVTETIIADTMRACEEVALASRPWVAGYIRVPEPGACSRCIVLAGKFYLFSDGFLRHPRCRCNHVPAPDNRQDVAALMGINSPERYFGSLSREEQDRIFTEAGAEAIREGADIGRVVNARRGMSRAQVGGRNVLTTTEGTTRRGRRPGQRQGIRLMPESIFEIAGDDRAEALRLLRLNGYLN